MRFPRPGRAGLLLVACIAGCGGFGVASSGDAVVADSAGVRIVTSSAAAWGERGVVVDSVPLVRIGADDSGPYQFSFVSRGLLLDDGGFAVAEMSANEVRIFDSNGRHLRTIGRTGRGPGEFLSLTGIFEYPGDSIVVYDQRERRATVLPLDGGTPRVIGAQSLGNVDAFGALEFGDLVLYNPGRGFRPDLPAGLQWTMTDVVLLDSVGGSRTIQQLPSRLQHIEPDGNTRPVEPGHYAIHVGRQDGFYWGTPDRYEIRFYDRGGTLRRIIRRPVTPPAVTQPMIDEWIRASIEERVRYEGPAAAEKYRKRYESMTFGERAPLFDRALIDGNDRLWVGEASWPASQRTTRRWSVFGADGAWLGDVEAPPDVQVLDSRAGLILGVKQESGEAPFIQLHRLIEP